MATREQGIRRTTTVTLGLAAASVAGAVVVGAVAAAGTTPKSATPTDSPTVDPSTGQTVVPSPRPQPQDPLSPPPGQVVVDDGNGPPITISAGS
jgi:hypothetical protein